MGALSPSPVPSRGGGGGHQRFKALDKVESGSQMGELATSPLPSRGVPNATKRVTK